MTLQWCQHKNADGATDCAKAFDVVDGTPHRLCPEHREAKVVDGVWKIERRKEARAP